MKTNDSTLTLSFLVWFLFASSSSAAGRIEEIDDAYGALEKCGNMTNVMRTSKEKRVNSSAIESLGTQCQASLSLLRAKFDALTENIEDRDNQNFLSGLSRDFDQISMKALKAVANMYENYRGNNKEYVSEDSILQLTKEVSQMSVTYTAAKKNIVAYYEQVKKKAEEVSREWDKKRSDDSVLYANNMEDLKKMVEVYQDSIRKGSGVVADVFRANMEWERANKTGQQEEIEKAYKKYHEMNGRLIYWQKEISTLNKRFSEISNKTGTGWQRFVNETKESFSLYNGEVAKANRRYHEFSYYVMGIR